MSNSGPKTLPSIGFLTVLEHPGQGWLGGYLLLNVSGRPLEFHCTAPVKPNRAQEILYGPTLQPFLFGEQIGHTLVTKSSLRPIFICTDSADVLSLREVVECPVVLIQSEDASAAGEDGRRLRVEGAHHGVPAPHSARKLGCRSVVLPRGFEAEFEQVAKLWAPHAEGVDLLEPFTRIREAVEETQRSDR